MESVSLANQMRTPLGGHPVELSQLTHCLVYGFQTLKQAEGKPTNTRTTRVFLSTDMRYLCWNSKWKSKEDARVELRVSAVQVLPPTDQNHWVQVSSSKRT